MVSPCVSGSQYMGQEEFYGEQYGHTPSSSEPINQQYYPDGNHTDPHTHSYKQFTCISTSLKHLSHLLLCLLFLFPNFLHFHSYLQFINYKVKRVFLYYILCVFCLFLILLIFKLSLRTGFSFNCERLWCAEISNLVPFFLFSFVWN